MLFVNCPGFAGSVETMLNLIVTNNPNEINLQTTNVVFTLKSSAYGFESLKVINSNLKR